MDQQIWGVTPILLIERVLWGTVYGPLHTAWQGSWRPTMFGFMVVNKPYHKSTYCQVVFMRMDKFHHVISLSKWLIDIKNLELHIGRWILGCNGHCRRCHT